MPRYSLDPDAPANLLRIDDGSPWYMSPDIWVNGSSPGQAVVPTSTYGVRLHLVSQGNYQHAESEVELFLGNPSLQMSPTAGTRRIGRRTYPTSDFVSGDQEQTISWSVVPSGTLAADDPAAPGHRCLIARGYPKTSLKPIDFQVPTDPHEAQRNIAVVAAASGGGGAGGAGAPGAGAEPMGPMDQDGRFWFLVDTTTLLAEKAERVTIQALHVPWMDDRVLEPLLPAIKEAGVEGFAQEAPEFQPSFDLPSELLPQWEYLDRGEYANEGTEEEEWIERREFPGEWMPEYGDVRPIDGRGWGKRGATGWEMDVLLEPERIGRMALKVDLARAEPGQAHIFHLSQVGEKGPSGGMTVIMAWQG